MPRADPLVPPARAADHPCLLAFRRRHRPRRRPLTHEMLHVLLFLRHENPAHNGGPWYREIRRLSPTVLATNSMSSGAAIVARFECPASGSARRGSRGRSHTRTLHGGPGRSGRLTMIGATRSIALPTKTRVAQGADSWVGRL